jgi:hypothetical protein
MRGIVCVVAGLLCLSVACAEHGPDLGPPADPAPTPDPERATGTLSVRLDMATAASFPGLASVRLNIIGPQHDCGDRGVAEQVVPVVDPVPWVDTIFVLPPGRYTLCLHGQDAAGQEIPECTGGSGGVMVAPNATSSVSSVLSCAQPRGAVAVHVQLNHAPVIDSFEMVPAAPYITRCTLVELKVTASDPEGDPIAYSWSWLDRAPLVLFPLDQPETRFLADPGDYRLRVAVTDDKRGTSHLDFPIHVEPCP